MAKNTSKASDIDTTELKSRKAAGKKAGKKKVKEFIPRGNGQKAVIAKPERNFKKLDKAATGAHRIADGSVRVKWNGHSIVSLIRWMGFQGANVATATEWLLALGISCVSENCVKCQTTSGRRAAEIGEAASVKQYGKNGGFYGNLPKLTKEEASYLKTVRPVLAETVE